MDKETETFLSDFDLSDFQDALEKLASDNIIYEGQYPFLHPYNMSRKKETDMIFECF